MKKSIHPQSHKVVFQDVVTGQTFLMETTMQPADKIVWEDGNTYPLVKVEVSSSSHPAFNVGKVQPEVTSSRREAFEKKYAAKV